MLPGVLTVYAAASVQQYKQLYDVTCLFKTTGQNLIPSRAGLVTDAQVEAKAPVEYVLVIAVHHATVESKPYYPGMVFLEVLCLRF